MDMASHEFKLRRVEPEAGILKTVTIPLNAAIFSGAAIATVGNWTLARAVAAATPIVTLIDHLPGDFAPRKGKYQPYLRYRIRARLVDTGGGAAAPTNKLQGNLRWHNPVYNTATGKELAPGLDAVLGAFRNLVGQADDVADGGLAVLAANDADFTAMRTYEFNPVAGMTQSQIDAMRPEAALNVTFSLTGTTVPANTRLDILSIEKVYRGHVTLWDQIRRMVGL